PEKQKVLLGILHDTIMSEDLPMSKRMHYLSNYSEYYRNSPSEVVKSFKKPLKMQYELVDRIKKAIRVPNFPSDELNNIVYSFQSLDSDFIRGLNHTL